ncbi:MAG: 23S rRNA (adenine(2030)-N(6))-methyltransferase RlmJ [Gammaproteobacteria bacterium]
MNYKHIYHSGNFTDVFKHCLLICLLESLFHKDKPIVYIDTHAGQAMYDLTKKEARISLEYKTGIGKLFSIDTKNIPVIVSEYLSIIHHYNVNAKTPTNYPGSILIANNVLREQDRIIGIESEENIYDILKTQTRKITCINIHLGDAYQKLFALIPPIEKRGLVLIDPAFEDPLESQHIIISLEKSLKKWPTGIYALWYPIKNKQEHKHLIQRIKSTFKNYDCLQVEFSIFSHAITMKLSGCGMIILNPPWQIELAIQNFLPWLWERLSPNNEGSYLINKLPKLNDK